LIERKIESAMGLGGDHSKRRTSARRRAVGDLRGRALSHCLLARDSVTLPRSERSGLRGSSGDHRLMA
jgi:hypothetical protein